MTKPSAKAESLRARLRGAADVSGLFLWDVDRKAGLSSLLSGTYLGGQLEALSGRSVLIATKNQLATALALIVFRRPRPDGRIRLRCSPPRATR